MIKQLVIVGMGYFIAAGIAVADPSTPPKHNPEWTDNNSSDPGLRKAKTAKLSIAIPAEPVESTIPELASIVVLCAQEEKKEFEKEWGKYVKHHDLKGEKLQAAILDVSDKAAAQRDQEWSKSPASKDKLIAAKRNAEEAQWKAERRKIMNKVARQIFEPSAR